MKNFIKNVATLSLGLLIAILVLEIFLRAFNPRPVRVKNDEIILPANRIFQFQNTHLTALDKNITHTKNSIGFRGEEPPYINDYVSIIGVGGSTTECRFLNDGMDWVTLLGENLKLQSQENIWVNNAGLDGLSTFGHQVLLKEHLVHIHPDYIIYLVGVNELERSDLHRGDKMLLKNETFSISDWLKKNSEVALLANNFQRSIWAYKIDLAHGNLDLKNKKHSTVDSLKLIKILKEQAPYLLGFEERLNQLVLNTKKAGITPVLLTHPLLFGQGKDDITGVNLETVQTRFDNGKTYWEILEKYNDISRKVAQTQEILLIDLAHQMPKSSLYFYDGIHFTNEGAEKVSDIISKYDFF